MKILVTPTSFRPDERNEAYLRLREFSSDLVFNEYGRPMTEVELVRELEGCDGCIAGLDYFTERVLNKCGRLKVISRYGAGYDRVDLKAAKENNIVVTNTPGVNAEAVGELVMGHVLVLARHILTLDKKSRQGEWTRSTGIELKGKTMGIIGLGAIGRTVARCAQGFCMKVITYDPYVPESYCNENRIEVGSFEDVIQKSNVISLHLPLNDQTYHLIDRDALMKMKENVILINTSRGGIINEEHAYDALQSGRLAGLGLDVFETEPPESSPLFQMDNVVITPHTGAHTAEAAENMARLSVDNIIGVLTGTDCKYIVG